MLDLIQISFTVWRGARGRASIVRREERPSETLSYVKDRPMHILTDAVMVQGRFKGNTFQIEESAAAQPSPPDPSP